MERKELNETLFTKVFQVVSHFNYEICELRRRPVGSHNLTHKLNRILEPKGSKTHIFQVFRQE
ncbi:hypothetical protein [Leptospira noguchii]|uniref:hypothetical protein n=1 Tax=Leptospira noguchii TaxID=28182 RepID=UPI001FB82179|nr:hypothetical protein [Leptospira noguchii]UOG53726.1 hypothetical protein MAL09_06240 [Leptospira noguchii]